jgi:cell division protein ZapE
MGAVLDAYERRVATGGLKPDSGQREVAERLDGLASALQKGESHRSLLSRLRKAPAPPRGIYIHGQVGRGKTMLMDLFHATVPVERKRRVHFHAFMQDVHARLHATRQDHSQDAIAPVARALAREARLFCLDEMQISDIADAMIVGRLFEALLSQGVVIATTSNLAPEELYRDGLNRQLFLPFISLMNDHLEIVALDSPVDYRLGRVKAHETFLAPLSAENDARLQDLWMRLTDTGRGTPMVLEILGRKLVVPQAAAGCARFSFAELCEAPLGAPDYLALAEKFRVLFMEHVPALGPERRNEAKRLVLLIDTLYDAETKLVVTSAQPPDGIYPAGDHALEFERTVSRLKEMQSAAWWGKKIAET